MELREALENNPDKDTLEGLYKTVITIRFEFLWQCIVLWDFRNNTLHDYGQANNRMMQWSNSFNNAFEEGNTVSAISALQRMSYFGRLCEAIKRELL